MIVPFNSKEIDTGEQWLHLQFQIAKDERTQHSFVHPDDLPVPLLTHVANEMKEWHEQAGFFQPCIGNGQDTRGTVRVHFSNTRNWGVWNEMGLSKSEYACLDCMIKRRYCVFRASKAQKVFRVLPLPAFAREGNKAEDGGYWRIKDGVIFPQREILGG